MTKKEKIRLVEVLKLRPTFAECSNYTTYRRWLKGMKRGSMAAYKIYLDAMWSLQPAERKESQISKNGK